MPNENIINQLLLWADRVEHGAAERQRLAEEREEAEYRAVQIEMDDITRRNEDQRGWNYESVSKASNC